jgi:hypothetical protein
MIKQKDDETRLEYLMRVLEKYMDQYGDSTIDYDETTCDGVCLYQDLESELIRIIDENDWG